MVVCVYAATPARTYGSRQSRSATDQAAQPAFAARGIIGTVDKVTPRLYELAAEAQVEELMILTRVPDQAMRRRSYELLAQAFNLQPA